MSGLSGRAPGKDISTFMASVAEFCREKPAMAVIAAISAMTLLRIAVLAATPLELGPDEAQYWRWAQTLDWGYYSKPPLIAWLIAATTALFGNAEWAVRLSAPIAHGFAAYFLFVLGRRAYSITVGAWSAALYMVMPGVWLSSTIMSTDAVLLPMWSASLLAFWLLREKPTLLSGVVAGVALGVAMLAKYAALYLIVGALIAAVFDKRMRKAVVSWSGLAAIAAAAIVLSPNLIWNAAHKFATVSHTSDNANWDNAVFDITHIFDFFLDQMAVFGPITLIALLAGICLFFGRKDRETTEKEFWLLSFIAPPLLVILAQAVISRAHANWAATAYPAACVLLASWFGRARWSNWAIRGSLVLYMALGAAFCVVWAFPSVGDSIGVANALKRVRGWKEMTIELADLAKKTNASVVMFDDRESWHGVDYYSASRHIGLPPLRAWRRGDVPRSYAEEAGAMQPGEDARVLIGATSPDQRPMLRSDFTTIEDLGYLKIALGPKRTRFVKMYLGSGYHPHPRTPEFENSFNGKLEPRP